MEVVGFGKETRSNIRSIQIERRIDISSSLQWVDGLVFLQSIEAFISLRYGEVLVCCTCIGVNVGYGVFQGVGG